MFLQFRKKYCPVCGVKGTKCGEFYSCTNCETVFSNFGIVKGPFDETLSLSEIKELRENN